MGGEHGSHLARNTENIKEEDSHLSQKIRPIELIKHNPQLFHLNFYDLNNHFECAGGAKTAVFALAGGYIALSYFLNGMRTRPYNFYYNLHQGTARFLFGAAVGGGIGFYKFGDRQKVHNAWVAERLRRRYPESMQLNTADLWSLKGIEAPQAFYKWK
uniref:Uncharacterized protein n=1 Tax=Strombidium rassoulzadegani TaxID=1082188 RepID=A0A7S3CIL4_9SPIT|mmetsp:Transcript_11294/g.19014  ORF Transcript_11294/g.19014 Transcript_11294/m.19014 type:complete len:158 (+) Transcript_11294:31-504(+)